MSAVEHGLVAFFILYMGHIAVWHLWLKHHPAHKKNVAEWSEIINSFLRRHF